MTSVEILPTLLRSMSDIESFWILSLGDMRSKDPYEALPLLRSDYQHEIIEYLQTTAVKPYEHSGVVKCFKRGSVLEWCPAPNDEIDHPVMIPSLKIHIAKSFIEISNDWLRSAPENNLVDEQQFDLFIKSLTSQELEDKLVIHSSLYDLCDLLLFVTKESIKNYIQLCSVPHVCNIETYFLVDGIQVPKIQAYSEIEKKRVLAIKELDTLIKTLN